jgi:TRAP-type C4-dicarboxylate transport system permease small subunit
MFQRLDSGLQKVYIACGYLAAICLAMICPMVIANIVGRWMGVFVPGTNEIGGYLMAAAGTLGMAYTFGLNGHIRVTMLVQRLPHGLRKPIEIASLVVAFCLVAYLSKHLLDMVLLSYEFGDRSMGTDNLLIWIPQAPVALGMTIFAISILHAIVASIVSSRAVFVEREPLS